MNTDHDAQRATVMDDYYRDLAARTAALAYAATLAAEFDPDDDGTGYAFRWSTEEDPDRARAWRYELHTLHRVAVVAREVAEFTAQGVAEWTGWADTVARALHERPLDGRFLTLSGRIADVARIDHRLARVVADADAVAAALARRARTEMSETRRAEDAVAALHTAGPDMAGGASG